jgi:CheY-like chemotaxis protein
MGRQILSQEGHEVVTVSNGVEALEYLSHSSPDLIMADTRKPGPNGYEVCREVKQSGRFPGVKVVLLAGPLEPFDPALADSAGSDAVLHKPLDAYSLIETINKLIGAADAEVPPPPEPDFTEQPDGEMFFEEDMPDGTLEQLVSAVSEDPFQDLVEEALGRADPGEDRETRVRGAVLEVLEASLPTLVDTITERVLARLNGKG